MKKNINNLNINEFEPIFNILEDKLSQYDLFSFSILEKIKENILDKIKKGS